MSDSSLRITELFHSIQGEGLFCGYPTVFIRLTGCPLRCNYCDSEYAFYGGEKRTIQSLLEEVRKHRSRHICVTGGEPLAQIHCPELLTQLCDQRYSVSLETSGALPIDNVDKRVCIVMDIKTPDSGEHARNRWANLALLKVSDQIKFVISSRNDFDWALRQIEKFTLIELVDNLFFSPDYHRLQANELAEWIVQSRQPIRMQIQLHKLLWGDKPGV